MSTEFPSKHGINRQWHVLDAEGFVLGKVASKTAMILMGKHKPSYTPFLDTGDHVVVINADKVRLTGRKEEQKVYRHFTGYPGAPAPAGLLTASHACATGRVKPESNVWPPSAAIAHDAVGEHPGLLHRRTMRST
jgi:ribosomal protein L13